MVRTGLLVGLTAGLAVIGQPAAASGVGLFAAVQLITLVVQGLQRASLRAFERRPGGEETR